MPDRINGVYFTGPIPNRDETFLNPLGHMPLTRDIARKLAMRDILGRPLWELEWVKDPAEEDRKVDITDALDRLECEADEKKVVIAAPKSLIEGEVIKEGETYLAETVPTKTTTIITEGEDPEIAERSLLETLFRQRFATAGEEFGWTPYFVEAEEKPVASFAMRRAWPEELVHIDAQGRKFLKVIQDGESVLIPEEEALPLPFHTDGTNVEGSGLLSFPGGGLQYEHDGHHWTQGRRIDEHYLPAKQSDSPPPISSNYDLAIHHGLAEHTIGDETFTLSRLGGADGWRPTPASVASLTSSIRGIGRNNVPLAFGVLPDFQADAERFLNEELRRAGYTRQGSGALQWAPPDDPPSTEELYENVMNRLDDLYNNRNAEESDPGIVAAEVMGDEGEQGSIPRPALTLPVSFDLPFLSMICPGDKDLEHGARRRYYSGFFFRDPSFNYTTGECRHPKEHVFSFHRGVFGFDFNGGIGGFYPPRFGEAGTGLYKILGDKSRPGGEIGHGRVKIYYPDEELVRKAFCAPAPAGG